MVVLGGGAVFNERGTPASREDALVLQEMRSRPQPCAFDRKGETLKGFHAFYLKAKADSGHDCFMCAIFARRRSAGTLPGKGYSPPTPLRLSLSLSLRSFRS